ncbi:MAG: hypothetical protein AAF501_04635, partial [Pseudomonadota bacterium]
LPPGAVPHLVAAEDCIRSILQDFFKKYIDVCPEELPKTLPPTRGLKDAHTIEIHNGAKPPCRPPYKQSPAKQLLINKQVKLLLNAGLVKPSRSAYAAPVLFVKKPDGSLPFCIDYRALKSITHKDSFPLPRAQDLIDRIS